LGTNNEADIRRFRKTRRMAGFFVAGTRQMLALRGAPTYFSCTIPKEGLK
jgi:hypothetical protein